MAQTGKNASEKAGLKVELDLDDAPFLDEDEEEEKAAPAAPEEKASPEPEQPPEPETPPAGKKKKLLMAGAGGVVIVILAVALNVFLFPGEKAAPPEPETPKAEPKTPPVPVEQEYVMQWEPFWVEMKDTEGASRFLTLRFSIPTKNQVVFAEMNAKKLILRDALFYYLRNQPIISLSDETKTAALKSDLMTVINEHLGSGKISDLLIQDYLLQ